jgi:hypothetical protein
VSDSERLETPLGRRTMKAVREARLLPVIKVAEQLAHF